MTAQELSFNMGLHFRGKKKENNTHTMQKKSIDSSCGTRRFMPDFNHRNFSQS